jgi:hypothetical protein
MLRLVLLLSLILCACVSPYRALDSNSEALTRQASSIAALKRNQLKAEISNQLAYPETASFDFQSPTHRFSFVSLQNDETGAGFGLFFVNDHLAYLLPPRETTIFTLCRALLAPPNHHWTQLNNSAFDSWLNEHSILESSTRADYQVPELRKTKVAGLENSTLVDTIVTGETLLFYSPFFILASPALANEALRDKSSDDIKRKEQAIQERIKRLQRQKSGFALIELGMNRTDVLNHMGLPDKTNMIATQKEYLWFEAFLGIILENGKVILKETAGPYWDNPQPMRAAYLAWFKRNQLNPDQECPRSITSSQKSQ